MDTPSTSTDWAVYFRQMESVLELESDDASRAADALDTLRRPVKHHGLF